MPSVVYRSEVDLLSDVSGRKLCKQSSFTRPCRVIRIPESSKFFLVESGILGLGIQNPGKKGTQNPFAENPFQIVLTAFTRIHAPLLSAVHSRGQLVIKFRKCLYN